MSIQRKTKSLKAVQNYFDNRSAAVSVVELVGFFKDEMNKATVYRILSRMESEGLIHSFSGMDGLTWYASCKGCSSKEHYDQHPHFQCKKCGRMECLEVNLSIPKIKNRKIDSEIVLFVGECNNCLS